LDNNNSLSRSERQNRCLFAARKNPSLQKAPSYFTLATERRLDATIIIRSPRERDVLNAMQEHQNLFKTNTILDLSQFGQDRLPF